MHLSPFSISQPYLRANLFAPPTRKQADNITGRTYLERGQPVVVLIRWRGKGPRNVLIARSDGTRVVRPFRGLRKEVQP